MSRLGEIERGALAFIERRALAFAPMPTSHLRSITAQASARRPVVLVIGNTRDELSGWVAMLREQGFDACGAEGGRAALRKAGETPPDLVVLDFRGRPSSGVAAARQICERHGSTKLLVANATSSIVLAQCLADYDAFIARPFKPAQLLRAIRGVLNEFRVVPAQLGQTASNLRTADDPQTAQTAQTAQRAECASLAQPAQPTEAPSLSARVERLVCP